MELRYEMINGKKVKLYPAFNTEAHAHDIDFRRNALMNEYDDKMLGDEHVPDEWFQSCDKLKNQLEEILSRTSYPITFLPWELYQVARETINWAGMRRGGC